MNGVGPGTLARDALQDVLEFPLCEYTASTDGGFEVTGPLNTSQPPRVVTWKYSAFRPGDLADRLALGSLRGDPLYATADQLRTLDRAVLLSDADPTATIAWLRLLARAQQLGVPCGVRWGGMNDAWIDALASSFPDGRSRVARCLIAFDDAERRVADLLFRHFPGLLPGVLGDHAIGAWRSGRRHELECVTATSDNGREGTRVRGWLVEYVRGLGEVGSERCDAC